MTQKKISKTWTSVQRRKLSAIRTPHRTEPKDFYYSAAEAWSALEAQGPPPAKLDPRTELTRWGGLMATRGISWSGSAGRCFTDEFCNPLISLALADGADAKIFHWITHGSIRDIMDVYSRLPLESLCHEMMKVRIRTLAPEELLPTPVLH
jgi:hypothetical protein